MILRTISHQPGTTWDGGRVVGYLELNGDRLAYRDAGAGEALLLIHGAAESSATWRAVFYE